MNHSESPSSKVTNQHSAERQFTLRDFLKKIFEPVLAKYIAFLTFIYLTVQFLAILGIIPEPYGIVPEPYRTLTILIATPPIILYILYKIYIYVVYDWGERKVKAIEWRFQKKLEQELNKQKYDLIKTFSEKPKEPRIDVEESLTNCDIEFAIYCLINKLVKSDFLIRMDYRKREFDPDKNIIIGIDRGGAIVGGLLGKGLRLATKNLGIYWAHPPLVGKGEISAIESGKCSDIDFSHVKKVILVDDAIRTGESMQAAINILEKEKETHNFEYKIVSVLNIYDVPGRKVNPHYFVYKTNVQNKDLKLPWDEHFDTMKRNIEFDELCATI